MTKYKMLFYLILFIVYANEVVGDIYDLDDATYKQMPAPYVMYDYGKCMEDPNGLYCVVQMALTPGDSSELYTIMQEYSKPVGHFNYTELAYGICVSETCKNFLTNTNQDDAVKSCMNAMIYEQYGFMIVMEKVVCYTPHPELKIEVKDIVVAAIVLGIVFLNIFGSVYDFCYTDGKKEAGVTFLLCFSIRRNWLKLTAPGAKGPEPRLRRLKSINGGKAVTTLLVVGAHALLPFLTCLDNPRFVENLYKYTIMKLLFNGPLVVQTYFIFSGFLMSYNLQLINEKQNIGWMMFPRGVILRWLRLTPPYALLIAITATWMRFTSFGPLREMVLMNEYEDCNKYWWQNLLYINNVFNVKQLCHLHSWYLAADTQLYILGLAICIICKSGNAKKIVLSTLLLIAFFVPPIVIYVMDLNSICIVTPKTVNNFLMTDTTFVYLYKTTYGNLFSYLLGLSSGFILYKSQKDNFDAQKYKKYRIFYWMLVPAAFLLISSGIIFYREGPRLPLYIRVIHGALAKPLFSLITAISFCLAFLKYEDVYRPAFEWEGWTVPSRLSYSAFLLHATVIKVFLLSRDTLIHVTLMQINQALLWSIVMTFVAALPLYLLVESPFCQLTKLMMASRGAGKSVTCNEEAGDIKAKEENQTYESEEICKL